jgi:hypothetical protein
MQLIEKVFIVYLTSDEMKPHMDYGLNDHIDWVLVSEYLNGTRPIEEYVPIEIKVDHPSATEWDYYACSGSYGLFSAKAVQVLGEQALKNYRLFPTKLNGDSYFLLVCANETDCLDRANSIYATFDEPSKFLLSIEKYSFFTDKIDADCIFSIPESNYMYCTQILENTINKQLQGFRLIEVFNSKT